MTKPRSLVLIDDQPHIPIRVAAEMIGTSRQWIHRLISEEALPSVRQDGTHYIPLKAFDSFMETRQRKGAPA